MPGGREDRHGGLPIIADVACLFFERAADAARRAGPAARSTPARDVSTRATSASLSGPNRSRRQRDCTVADSASG
jgi:hypothetical protein